MNVDQLFMMDWFDKSRVRVSEFYLIELLRFFHATLKVVEMKPKHSIITIISRAFRKVQL